MTDKIQPYDRTVADAARAADVKRRERLARPMSAGADLLKSQERRPLDGMDERFGFAADSQYLKD